MESDLLDQLLDEFEIDHDQDTAATRSATSTQTAEAASTPTPSPPSPSFGAKRIRPELDPLPLESTESRTEYYTVNDYVWPTPKKRQCIRMPDEERRQRHRESQREFMTRKRSQFRAMRAEISRLESQVRWLEARRTLKTLMVEQQQLEAKLTTVVGGIQADVWKQREP